MKISKTKLSEIVREEIRNVLTEDYTVDVIGKIQQSTLKHLQNSVDELEEELGVDLFGRKVYLEGKNIQTGKQVEEAEGIVSLVNVYIKEDPYRIDLKIKFQDSRVFTDVKKIDVIENNRTPRAIGTGW